jgi:hemolysin activation/secretion protein
MQYPGEEFDLGLTFSPRAYPIHAFTGDRAFFTSAEYRWVAIPDVLKLGLMTLGFAAFAAWGEAWYDGSRQRTGKDWGVGLPLGGMRAASGKGATRIDLARRYANDAVTSQWVLSIGSGFAFERISK